MPKTSVRRVQVDKLKLNAHQNNQRHGREREIAEESGGKKES